MKGGADAVSMINTINSLMGVDLDTWNTIPHVAGKRSPWRLLWTGGEANCVKHGSGMCSSSAY
ncbi:hypothetical protein GCM10020331_014780 [Ectobacillus funiculus]